ncbi:hypothetical protein AKJ09_06786 [Labilithrix luteola]|uniref:Lipoprotein n=1 Tax=Labilithrix luteola TaxID=1391654 RepID=A0A0K1Q324_9BACT|nr:hypothetical protein [Labilithrix luteola]AKV00123.1 hypothetical protein AKJ09_06786 [Labilithrix luteola]
MMTKISVRIGLIMTMAVAVGAQLAAACGGDDVPAAAPTEADAAGASDTGAPQNEVEAGSDAGTVPGPFVSFVHDSEDYPEFTPCFVGADNTPLNPTEATFKPFRGSPIVTAVAGRWASDEVRLVALPKDSAHKCDATAVAAIGIDGVKTLKTFPAGTFTRDKSYVVMLLGCEIADFNLHPWCYADWDGKKGGGTGTPTRRLEVVEVDSVPVGAGGIGIQFIQASPSIQWNLSTIGDNAPGPAVHLRALIVGGDPALNKRTPDTGYAGFGAAPPAVPAKAVKSAPKFLDKQDDSFFGLYYEADGGVEQYALWNGMNLVGVELNSTTKAVTYTYFQDGNNYVFIFLSPTSLAKDGYLIGLPTRW